MRHDRTPGPGTTGPTSHDMVQIGLAQAAVGFTVGALGGNLVLLARDLDTPISSLAWLSSTFGAGLLLVGVVPGLLLARGPLALLRGAAAMAAAGSVLLAVAPLIPIAVTGAMLLGIGFAGIVLATPALLRGPDAGRRIARVSGISSVSGIVAPLAQAALDAAGPGGRTAMLIGAVPLLVLTATARRPRPAVAEPVVAEPVVAELAVTAGRSAAAGALVLWAAVVLAVSVEFCFAVWAVARLQETGLSTPQAAATGAVFGVGMAAGRLLGGRVATRRALVPVGCAVVAVATVLVAIGSSTVVATGLGLAGSAIAMLYPVTLARLVAALPASRGPGLGALASGTAILLAPAGLGVLAGVVPLSVAFLVAVLPLVVFLVVLDVFVRSWGRGEVGRRGPDRR